MEHDQKLMVGSPKRCRTYLPLVALLALWLPTSSSEATFKTPDTLRVASVQSGLTHLVAAKSKSRSARVSTVNNLRVSQKANQHRLVLDLARPFRYTQQRLADPDRLVINLKNAVLSRTAKNKIIDDRFPIEVEVMQVSPRNVRVVLDMESITTVKLRKLTRPYRLVLDYIAQSENSSTSTPQPKVTLPPVSRQITQDERLARLDIETIVLDPGHGGRDPGAIGPGGLTEKEVVLDVARRLRDLLRDRLGKKVLMTRDKDVFAELDDRAKFANGHKADLFVSIHINSHPRRTTRGIEMYHFGTASDRRAMEVAARENGDTIDHARDFVDMIKADLALSKRIEESQNLAWETKLAVANHVGAHYSLEDHGVKTAPFYVLRYTAMPSILVELAFISNPIEERRLRQPDFRQKVAEGLFEGIRNYLNSVQVALAR
ncbi:MAG TPA: N-acetylmuramoyl-L-alanine amidase [Nitrospirales bacterium]|nr:N-acetylmuramoyl-L-alanine amidase [Nitrospirales bacterium]